MNDRDKRDAVYAALTDLYGQGGALVTPPLTLKTFFDELRLAKTARKLMQRPAVSTHGKAILITAGPPGAGKSQVLDQLDLEGYRRIDPDEIKDVLLEKAEGAGELEYRKRLSLPDNYGGIHRRELSSHVHACSTYVADLMRASALSQGENVVIDGSLSWSPLPQQYVGELLEAGYETATVISVETTEELAVERARERWWTARKMGDPGGRFVPEVVVRACFENSESRCVKNALGLVEQARDELGTGRLLQYKVDPTTGESTVLENDG